MDVLNISNRIVWHLWNAFYGLLQSLSTHCLHMIHGKPNNAAMPILFRNKRRGKESIIIEAHEFELFCYSILYCMQRAEDK